MTYQRTLYFGGTDAMSGYVENIVRAAEDGDVSVFIFHGDVARDVTAGEVLPVALVTGGIAPYRAKHAGEGALQGETSADVGRNGLAVFIEDIGFSAGNGYAHFAGTQGADSGKPEIQSRIVTQW